MSSAPTINFYLIRHAECEQNLVPHLVGGRSNHSCLTERGVKQAGSLAERLYSERISIDKFYSSPAIRTRDTARIVAAKLSFPAEGIVFSDELMELDQGDWQGRKKSEVYTPEMLKIINSSQPYFKAPNGESQYTVGKRMLVCLEQIIDSNENGNSTIAVFTHGIAIKCLLRELLNFPPENVYKTILENTSITELEYVQGNWQVIRINDAEHLQKNRL